MLNLKKSIWALAVACALGAIAVPAHALIATDATFGTFDFSAGSRDLTITGSEVITDVNITIVFAKCEFASLGPGAQVGDPCLSLGFSFEEEIVFQLTHGATTVDLVVEGTYSGSTPGAGVVRITPTSAIRSFGRANPLIY